MISFWPLEIKLPKPYKACHNCGRKYTRQGWGKLPYVGVMADDVETLEMRNCPCGSTLGVSVTD